VIALHDHSNDSAEIAALAAVRLDSLPPTRAPKSLTYPLATVLPGA